MEITAWILFLLSLLMYLEGLLFSSIINKTFTDRKGLYVGITLLWPLSLPYVCYCAYTKYEPIIKGILPLLTIGEDLKDD